jgi:hypothetical protein
LLNTQDSQEQRFHLGNGKETLKEEEAYLELLQRDFPNFNFEDRKQKEILFTPPQYLHNRMDIPDTSTPEFEKMREKMNPGCVSNIEGDDFEAFLFYSVKQFLSSKFQNESSKNITVLQGWRRRWTLPKLEPGPGDEHDLIVLDGTRNLIILFEAKMSLSKKGRIEIALTQLKNQAEYFRKHHCHVLSPGVNSSNILHAAF